MECDTEDQDTYNMIDMLNKKYEYVTISEQIELVIFICFTFIKRMICFSRHLHKLITKKASLRNKVHVQRTIKPTDNGNQHRNWVFNFYNVLRFL